MVSAHFLDYSFVCWAGYTELPLTGQNLARLSGLEVASWTWWIISLLLLSPLSSPLHSSTTFRSFRRVDCIDWIRIKKLLTTSVALQIHPLRFSLFSMSCKFAGLASSRSLIDLDKSNHCPIMFVSDIWKDCKLMLIIQASEILFGFEFLLLKKARTESASGLSLVLEKAQ